MEQAVLNFYDTNWKKVGIIDVYSSLIWTRRFTTYGDFELYVPYKPLYSEFIKINYYAEIENDPIAPQLTDEIYAMIVEHVEIIQEPEQPTMMLIKGRSLTSILYRRVFYDDIVLSKSTTGYDIPSKKAFIGYLLRNCFGITVSESEAHMPQPQGFAPSRAIRYQFYPDRIRDPIDNDSRVRTVIKNDNLGESIDQYLSSYGYGISTQYNKSAECFMIRLFQSHDRTDTVIFRSDLDNLANCHYIKDTSGYANVVRVSTGEASITAPAGEDGTGAEHTGIERYELAVNNDLLGDDPKYTRRFEALQASGQRQLREFENTEDISADIINSKTFSFGIGDDYDYTLGDTVRVETDFGLSASVQIKEITQSWSIEGYTVYPTFGTFKVIEDIEEEDDT